MARASQLEERARAKALTGPFYREEKNWQVAATERRPMESSDSQGGVRGAGRQIEPSDQGEIDFILRTVHSTDVLSTGKSRSDLLCDFFKTILVLNREGVVRGIRVEERELLREKMMVTQTGEALAEKTSGRI